MTGVKVFNEPELFLIMFNFQNMVITLMNACMGKKKGSKKISSFLQ